MDSFAQVLDLAKLYCKENLTDIIYDLWINCTEPVSFDGTTAVLSVDSDFKKKILDTKYIDIFKQAFEHVLGFSVDVEIISLESTRPETIAVKPTFSSPSIDHLGGDYDYTFNTFIVGQSNKFAHAASQAVAANPAKAYNPLFIYGGSGLGKTHLLYAICHEIDQNCKHTKKIKYVKGDDFTNELIESIKMKTTNEFHEKYRTIDVLLVDDIQFIGGKESTQEEFFHTFNTLYESEKQIVLTSDRPPKEIKTLEDRLRTRFEWGLIADIQPPDFETRIAIIRRKAQLLDIDIPDDVSQYIANKLKNNIRQLEGAVKKIKAYKLITGMPPSISTAQKAISDILTDNQPASVTVDRIITEVARTFDVSPDDIKSNKRAAQISMARQVAIYVVRDILQMPMTVIGESFGGRDHSTIVYALNQVEKNSLKDSRYKETIEDIIKNIRDS